MNDNQQKPKSSMKAIVGAIGAAVVFGVLAIVFLADAGHGGELVYSCDGDRVVVIDLSSSNRGDEAVTAATNVIADHVMAAKVCDEELRIVGVAGGTQVLIKPADLIGELDGPNPRARARDVDGKEDAVDEAVAAALDEAYSKFAEVAITSIPALYQAAADHSQGETLRIVLLTTGVHDDDDLTLNRPLTEGEGARLTQTLTWPALAPDTKVVVVGIGQLDEELPAPGALWPRELTAFNRAACAATGADCSVYQVADSSDALV